MWFWLLLKKYSQKLTTKHKCPGNWETKKCMSCNHIVIFLITFHEKWCTGWLVLCNGACLGYTNPHCESLYFYIYPPAQRLVLQATHLWEKCSYILSGNSSNGSIDRGRTEMNLKQAAFCFTSVQGKGLPPFIPFQCKFFLHNISQKTNKQKKMVAAEKVSITLFLLLELQYTLTKRKTMSSWHIAICQISMATSCNNLRHHVS